LFGNKSKITNEYITDFINYLQKENKITQERIDSKLELKKSFQKEIELSEEYIESVSEDLPESFLTLLENTMIIARQQSIEGLDIDIRYLNIDIEDRNEVIKVLEEIFA
jgi:hypothetical protein